METCRDHRRDRGDTATETRHMPILHCLPDTRNHNQGHPRYKLSANPQSESFSCVLSAASVICCSSVPELQYLMGLLIVLN